jgi:hypothetical protein
MEFSSAFRLSVRELTRRDICSVLLELLATLAYVRGSAAIFALQLVGKYNSGRF